MADDDCGRQSPRAAGAGSPFNLKRYFSLTSLLCTLLIAAALGWICQHLALRDLVHQAEESNRALTRAMANSMWPKLALLVEESPAMTPTAIRERIDATGLRDATVRLMRNTEVMKVKVYHLQGRTVFSTDLDQIGEDKIHNLGFAGAAAGRTVSDLTHRDTFDSFEGTIQDLDVLATYSPILDERGGVVAVFEIYSDVTHLIEHIRKTRTIVALAVVGLLGVLYVLLHLLVARAQALIDRQSAALRATMTQLAETNNQLDQRIQERTAVLRAVNRSLRSEIEERREAEEKLRLAACVFDSSAEGIVITGIDERIIAVNRAFSAVTGYRADEVLGQTPRILQSGRQDTAFYTDLWQRLQGSGQWQGEVWNRRKNGEIYPEWLSISVIRDHNQQPTHYVGVFSDISSIKASQEKLDFLAHHDPLTGLANRLLFTEQVEQTIRKAIRDNGRFALLFIDLDHFKHVNDSLGHEVGDRFLQAVAARLQGQLRDSDTIARLGGDEFTLIIDNIADGRDAALVAQKVIDALRAPIDVDQHELYVTASVGISLYPDDGEDVQTLVKHADTAMYQAKAHGRNAFHFYAPEMTAYATERLQLEAQLRRSLAQGEMEVLYQPQVDIGGDELLGVEALLRWNHPTQPSIAPLKFIPIAEETGFIGELGVWVMRTACRQLARWDAEGLHVPHMAVNVSARQFERPEFVAQVAAILAETGVRAERLELEITESILMQTDNAYQILEDLRALGVCLSVDDFGTGYSSLSYLKRLPIQKLKIDRSFIMDLATDANDAAIIRAVIALARTMDLDTVAEGVESAAQADFLRAEGCTIAQGFHYARPMRGDALADWAGIKAARVRRVRVA